MLLSAVVWGQATLPVSRTVWNAGAPTGWTESGTVVYLSSFACSATADNNGGGFNSTGDTFQVNFIGTANLLSFRSRASAPSAGCILLVEESPDASSWSTVVSNTTLPTSCTGFSYSLLSASRYVRWTYTRAGTITLSIDDVAISAVTSSNSDIIAVTGSEATSISTTINSAAPLNSGTGVQAWQFKVRDGGATLSDVDGLPTILNALTITQASGNAVGTWTDAINTVALFDGTTFIATGTVTANTIAFTGLSGAAVTVADNTEKTFSLRLSIKCPMGSDAKDGEDFRFSISNANTTFSASGSGKTTFTAAASANTLNTLAVVATKLTFSVNPPSTVGMNGAMNPSVRVIATDACGNLDTGYTGTISVTSNGTMAASPQTSSATSGLAIFSSIIHTAAGGPFILTATAPGLTLGTSTNFTVTNTTALQPGDIAVLAFNNSNTSSHDELSFMTFVDILPGTVIDITDNGYRKCSTTGNFGLTEGWIRLTKTVTTLPKGTVVTVTVSSGTPTVVSGDSANWTAVRPSGVAGSFDLNGSGEQIFFLTGGSLSGFGMTTPNVDTGTYSGYFVAGFNTKGNIWTPVCNGGTNTQNSGKPDFFDCFLAWPTSIADKNKYTGPTTAANKRQWIERVNLPANWSNYTTNPAYLAGPNFAGAVYTVNAGGFSNGLWIGDVSSNWFDCSNWQGLKVPDETVNVILDATSTATATIDATATYAILYGSVAKCKDLIVSSQKVELIANTNNILTAAGNVAISASGIVAMDDSNAGTVDGQINVAGNWTNSVGTAGFQRGNGTVTFNGVAPQVINSVAAEGTETFYNVKLDNDFTTSASGNIIAKNNLQVKVDRTLTISPATYVEADMNFTNDGTVMIKNSGTLYQSNDAGIDDGNISMERNTTINRMDYVYWSSPIVGFNVNNIITAMPTGYIYQWNPTVANPNGGLGFWQTAAGSPMAAGKGYIAKGPSWLDYSIPTTLLATFYGGKPNNGVVPYTISRGAMTAATLSGYTSANGVAFTVKDDNWNLVGNPYPSAIDAISFLNHNTTTNNVIEGAVRIWTHSTLPVSTTNPFYNSYTYNYAATDYITYNITGSQTGPQSFAGNIAAGQGFFVIMNEGAASTATLQFNNSMRVKDSNPNAQFFRTAQSQTETENERHRIWMDLIGPTGKVNRTLVGYLPNATIEKDQLYDAYAIGRDAQDFYSVIGGEAMCIQGRPLPMNQQDQVPLGIRLPTADTYKIAIAYVDGLFEDATQPVYLEDKTLNIIHDLRSAPYSFTALAGSSDERFVLRYNDSNLASENFENAANNVVVATGGESIKLRSYNENMSAIAIYDVLGREIFNSTDVNNKEYAVALRAVHQTLIVKIKLESGLTVTRKIVF